MHRVRSRPVSSKQRGGQYWLSPSKVGWPFSPMTIFSFGMMLSSCLLFCLFVCIISKQDRENKGDPGRNPKFCPVGAAAEILQFFERRVIL